MSSKANDKTKDVGLQGIICGDCQDILEGMPDDCVDLLLSDPPYGLSFMGKNWDKAVPSVDIWKECLRVLKPGAWAFVMCIPRQDCFARMIVNLEDAGFDVAYSSLYHAFASGFPKAANLSKMIDKRLGAEREVVDRCAPDAATWGRKKGPEKTEAFGGDDKDRFVDVTVSATPQAQALDGCYSGAQFKPALEIVIVAQKPFTDKITRSALYKVLNGQYDYWYTERTEVSDKTDADKKRKAKLEKKWGRKFKAGDVIERRLALVPELNDEVTLNRKETLWSRPYKDSDVTSTITQALRSLKDDSIQVGGTWLDSIRIPVSSGDSAASVHEPDWDDAGGNVFSSLLRICGRVQGFVLPTTACSKSYIVHALHVDGNDYTLDKELSQWLAYARNHLPGPNGASYERKQNEAQGFRIDCLACRRLYDELSRLVQADAQEPSPSPADVLAYIRRFALEHEHIPTSQYSDHLSSVDGLVRILAVLALGCNSAFADSFVMVYSNYTRYGHQMQVKSRFPANLICSDDVLNDGRMTKSVRSNRGNLPDIRGGNLCTYKGDIPDSSYVRGASDSGSFSRYFSLESWAAKNLPWLDGTSIWHSNGNTSCEQLAALDAHIQRTGGSHSSVAYLYELSLAQRPSVSCDTVLSHSTLSIVLEQHVPVLLRNLGTLLSALPYAADLHSRLVANEALCAQSLRALADFLDGYQEDRRLHDALQALAQGLSPELLWLLACVLEQHLWNWRDRCRDDRHEDTSHQMLPLFLLLACYGVIHSLPQITEECKSEMWQAKLSQLPESVRRTFPFLVVPKAGKKEKNLGCDDIEGYMHEGGARTYDDVCANCGKKLVGDSAYRCDCGAKETKKRVTKGNYHPTVKPLKLMCYLITLGSRPGDLVLDPFAGTCTTGMAAKMLGRDYLMIEMEEKWCHIGQRRIAATQARLL